MKIAISYARWSSPKQRLGDSKRRQLEQTEIFCAEHGLILDQQLVDDGKSAYKGLHRKDGTALSRFLENLKAGRIPRGTVLIVESLDRLSRQTVLVALRQFLEILEHGVEIVTLVDRQWYSQQSLGNDSAPLLMSLVYMMRAHDEVKHKVQRLRAVWTQKRKLAIESNAPMTCVCPGWLRLDKHEKCYKAIPARVRIVKLVYWLYNRGWSKRRIGKLFNRHSIPTWGVGGKRADAWHPSYLQKMLHNRAVLGEFVPHSLTKVDADNPNERYVRQPASPPIKNFYPAIINPALFEKVQQRGSGPRGPIGPRVGNLFQGLLKDGDHPDCAMYYRDHGGKWRYLESDYRRKNPGTPLFAWNYCHLESQVLKYLAELDWRTLQEGKGTEIRSLKKELATVEGQLAELDKEAPRLVELATEAPDVSEVAHRLQKIDAERGILRKKIGTLLMEIRHREGFVEKRGNALRALMKELQKPEIRLRLQVLIREYLSRIELFQKVPKAMSERIALKTQADSLQLEGLLNTRCIRLVFVNGAERWMVAGLARDSPWESETDQLLRGDTSEKAEGVSRCSSL